MKKTRFRNGAVIVGDGSSQRMGADKVFLSLAGKPLLAWSIDTCHTCELFSKIVVVLNESNIDSGQKLINEMGWSKKVSICIGGKRRQDSVRQGIKEIGGCDWILIHDGARPFLTTDLIHNGLTAVRETGAAVAAIPVKDTIKLGGDDNIVRKTLNRHQLWITQTPQVFRSDIITRAHENITGDVTDDASMVEQLAYKVKLYMGSYSNIKITTPEDLALAEIIARGI